MANPPVTPAAPGTPAGKSIGTVDEGLRRLEQLGADFVDSLPALGVGVIVIAVFLLIASGTRIAVQRQRH